MVICLEQGADLHMAQLMPLPLTVSCCSKIQIGFTFLLPAHPGSPGKRAIKRVCMYVPWWRKLCALSPSYCSHIRAVSIMSTAGGQTGGQLARIYNEHFYTKHCNNRALRQPSACTGSRYLLGQSLLLALH